MPSIQEATREVDLFEAWLRDVCAERGTAVAVLQALSRWRPDVIARVQQLMTAPAVSPSQPAGEPTPGAFLDTDTWVGKKREENEDSIATGGGTGQAGDRMRLIAVADGMGGHADGLEASRAATAAVAQRVDAPMVGTPAGEVEAYLTNLMEDANAAVREATYSGGTTLNIVAYSTEPMLVVHAHVGDSPIYWIRNGVVLFRSEDQNVYTALLRQGVKEPDERNKRRLLSSLGRHEHETLTGSFEPQPGDVVVIGSDGMDEIPPEQIVALSSKGVLTVAKDIVDAVKETEARDNVTVAALVFLTPVVLDHDEPSTEPVQIGDVLDIDPSVTDSRDRRLLAHLTGMVVSIKYKSSGVVDHYRVSRADFNLSDNTVDVSNVAPGKLIVVRHHDLPDWLPPYDDLKLLTIRSANAAFILRYLSDDGTGAVFYQNAKRALINIPWDQLKMLLDGQRLQLSFGNRSGTYSADWSMKKEREEAVARRAASDAVLEREKQVELERREVSGAAVADDDPDILWLDAALKRNFGPDHPGVMLGSGVAPNFKRLVLGIRTRQDSDLIIDLLTNTTNKASRALFEHMTSVKLPKTQRDSKVALTTWFSTPSPAPPEQPAPAAADDILYFAYGSNLKRSQMASRVLGSTPKVKAVLPGYRLAFAGRSTLWGGAPVATVIPEPNSEVQGALYTLPDTEGLERMDTFEGYPKVYDRKLLTVVGEDGVMYRAWVYTHNSPESPNMPSSRYMDAVRKGKQEWGIEEGPMIPTADANTMGMMRDLYAKVTVDAAFAPFHAAAAQGQDPFKGYTQERVEITVGALLNLLHGKKGSFEQTLGVGQEAMEGASRAFADYSASTTELAWAALLPVAYHHGAGPGRSFLRFWTDMVPSEAVFFLESPSWVVGSGKSSRGRLWTEWLTSGGVKAVTDEGYKVLNNETFQREVLGATASGMVLTEHQKEGVRALFTKIETIGAPVFSIVRAFIPEEGDKRIFIVIKNARKPVPPIIAVIPASGMPFTDMLGTLPDHPDRSGKIISLGELRVAASATPSTFQAAAKLNAARMEEPVADWLAW